MNKPLLTILEKLLITLSSAGIVGIFAYMLYLYQSLPNTVPTHYNIYGEPDDFSQRGWIWFGPFMTLALFLGSLAVPHFIKEFNNIVEVTEENRERLYKNGRLSLHVLTFEIVIHFLIDTIINTEVIKGNTTTVFSGAPPYLFFGIIMATILFFAIRSFRLK
jgi:uncharacterized membrane protein